METEDFLTIIFGHHFVSRFAFQDLILGAGSSHHPLRHYFFGEGWFHLGRPNIRVMVLDTHPTELAMELVMARLRAPRPIQ